MPGFRRRLLFAGVLSISLAWSDSSFGYAFLDSHWFTNTIPMRVQLGPSDVPLADGSPTYDASIENALALWNEQIAGTQFTWTVATPGASASDGDGVNSMQLSSTIYGDKFGAGVLAVTLINNSGSQTTETDVLFNKANPFNSYRSTAYAAGVEGQFDIHRIALHELGHVLGLDHPDDHGQTVDAIMNAHVSTLDSLQADDIAGAVALYGAPQNPPTPTGNGRLGQISTRGMVGIGDDVMIGGFIIPDGGTKTVIARAIGPSLGALGVSDPLQNPILQLYDSAGALIGTNDDWRSAQEQEILATHLAPGNNLESAIVTDLEPGAYTAIVSGANGSTGVALVEIYDLAPETGKLGNISTRGYVGLDDDVLIGGFTVVGPQSEQLLVRGIGPSLANSGVLDPLAKPFLAIYNSNGDVFRSSDDSTAIEPSITFESAPGSFTAILSSINYLPGVGLIAIYAEN